MMEDQLTARRSLRGQSLVEFALTLPVLLLVFMGILDFARVLITYTQASAQVRNALRYGVILGYDTSGNVPNYEDCDGMRNIAQNVLFAENVDVDVDYLSGADGSTLESDCTTAASVDLDNGDIIRVSVTGNVELLTPFLAQTLQLDVAGQRTVVQGIDLPRLGLPSVGTPAPLSASCQTTIQNINDGTWPANYDYEPDGLLDLWECNNFNDLDEGPADNPDGDLCHNECEQTNNTDPNDPRSPNLRVGAPTELPFDDTDLDGRNDASLCTDFPFNRWVGLQWNALDTSGYTGISAVTGYQVYATPVNGPRFLIADLPAGTTSCGYSQDTADSGCFEALPNSTYAGSASDFWTQFGSRTIDYSVVAYNDDGNTVDSLLTGITCVFRVEGLTGLPEDAGTNCQDAADGTSEAPYFRGLTWNRHDEADGYYVYATKQQTRKVADIPQSVAPACGFSVGDEAAEPYGCFHLDPNFWQTGKTFSFRVRPYFVGATTIEGPAVEAAPPGAWQAFPECPVP